MFFQPRCVCSKHDWVETAARNKKTGEMDEEKRGVSNLSLKYNIPAIRKSLKMECWDTRLRYAWNYSSTDIFKISFPKIKYCALKWPSVNKTKCKMLHLPIMKAYTYLDPTVVENHGVFIGEAPPPQLLFRSQAVVLIICPETCPCRYVAIAWRGFVHFTMCSSISIHHTLSYFSGRISTAVLLAVE